MEVTPKSTGEEFQHKSAPKGTREISGSLLGQDFLVNIVFQKQKELGEFAFFFFFFFLTKSIGWNGVVFGQTLDKA